MSPRAGRPGKIWIPRPHTPRYIIKISAVDVTNDAVVGGTVTFSKALVGIECGGFKFNLENTDSAYSEKYSGGETVELYLDMASGTNKRFTGSIEKLKSRVQGSGRRLLEISGTHVTSELLDKLVTETYSGVTTDAILKDLIDKYLTGFTYTNVGAEPSTPTINWENKPLWDCIVDLCNIAEYSCYVDDDKDFHYFSNSGIENNDEAIWSGPGGNMLESDGLSTNTAEVKNKILVVGEDPTGYPVLFTSTDSSSQSVYGTKELLIKDTEITSSDWASDRASAELTLLKSPVTKGSARSLVLPSLSPGDKIRISDPVNKIHGQFVISRFEHVFPQEHTTIEVETIKKIPLLFKDRMTKELAIQKVDNPYKMEFSYNFPFDNYDNIDTGVSTSNVAVSDSKLYLSSLTTGTMKSKVKTVSDDISFVHLKVSGNKLVGTKYWVSADAGDSRESITPEVLKVIPVTKRGKKLRLEIELNSSDTEVEGAVLLFK